MTIQEIRTKFRVDSTDVIEISETLRKRRADIHPDRNGGDFENEEQKREYNELDIAINELKEIGSNSQLLVIDKLTDLATSLGNLVPNSAESQVESRLAKKVDSAAIEAKNRTKLPRVSLAAVTAFLTFLVVLPNNLIKYPIVAEIVTNEFFIVSWLGILLLTGLYWIQTFIKDDRIKSTLSSLTLEPVQDRLFYDFASSVSEKPDAFFTTTELTRFILRETRLWRGSYSTAPELQAISQDVAEILIQKALSKDLIEPKATKRISSGYCLRDKDGFPPER